MTAGARAALVLAAILCPVIAEAAAAETAQSWYARMQKALATQSYEGVIVYMGNGRPGSYRLVACSDGYARLTALLGPAREVIRGPNIAIRRRADGSSMVVHGLAGDGSMLPFPPASRADAAALNHYRLNLAGWGRVAGQSARVLAFEPTDDWRYGYRVWISDDSGLPLRSELLDDNGQVLEQAFFTAITPLSAAQARAEIGTKALALVTRDENAASRDAVGFCPAEHGGKLAPQGLPPGFRVLRTVCEHQSGLDGPVTHLLVGDGLAMVSVFIAPYRSNGTALIGVTALGAVHAVGRVAGGYAITAMGDAPSITISRIASAVEVTKH